MSNPPETPARSKRKIIFAVISVIILVAALAEKPVYHELRKMRARGIATEAEMLAKQGRYREAMDKVASAARLGGDDPNLLRRLARFETEAGLPQALALWKSVLESGHAEDADRVAYARLALQLERIDLARDLAGKLVEQSPKEAEGHLITAEIALRYRKPGVAEAALRAGLAHSPENPKLSNALARLLLMFPDPARQKEAIALFEQTSRLDSHEGREALRLLLRAPAPRTTKEDALARLRTHPQKTPDDDLAALGAEMELLSGQKNELLKKAVAHYQAAAPDEKLRFARWLNRNRLHSVVTEVFDLQEAMSRKDYFLVYADALALLGRWDELNTIFRDKEVPLDLPYAHVFRARIAKEMGDRQASKLYWEQAEVEAGSSKEALWFVARYAELSKEPKQALRAIQRLTEDPVSAPEAFRVLVRFQERNGSTREIRDAVLQMLGVLPESLEAKNDLAYLNLLMNENVEQARQIASELVEKYPEFLAFRITLALASLRLGDPKAAAVMVGDLAIDWTQAQPGWQAVRAAVLGANERKEEAADAARKIDQKRLKPEEQALVAPYL